MAAPRIGMQVLAAGSPEMLHRPCVDCGLRAGWQGPSPFASRWRREACQPPARRPGRAGWQGPDGGLHHGVCQKHDFEYRAPTGSLDHWEVKEVDVRSAAGDPMKSAAGDPNLEHLFHPAQARGRQFHNGARGGRRFHQDPLRVRRGACVRPRRVLQGRVGGGNLRDVQGVAPCPRQEGAPESWRPQHQPLVAKVVVLVGGGQQVQLVRDLGGVQQGLGRAR